MKKKSQKPDDFYVSLHKVAEIFSASESVRIARETDRRLKARSRGRMNRILDVTYQAIRRRPEVFLVHY